MPAKPKAPPRRKPKALGAMLKARTSSTDEPRFDLEKSERATRAANQAADKLLRDMDDFLKGAGRKT